MIISVREFCDKNNLKVAGIYQKIRRKESELEGHVIKRDGFIALDEVAQELLKPQNNKKSVMRLKKIEEELSVMKAEQVLSDKKLKEQETLIESMRKGVSDLKEKNELLMVKMIEKEHMINDMKKELSNLSLSISVLKSEMR